MASKLSNPIQSWVAVLLGAGFVRNSVVRALAGYRKAGCGSFIRSVHCREAVAQLPENGFRRPDMRPARSQVPQSATAIAEMARTVQRLEPCAKWALPNQPFLQVSGLHPTLLPL